MLLLERVLDLLLFPCLVLPLLEVTSLAARVLFSKNRTIARNSLNIPVEEDPFCRKVEHLHDTVQLPRLDVWVGDS